MTFFEYIAEEVREHLAAARASAPSRRRSASVEVLDVARGDRPLEGRRVSTSPRSCTSPTCREQFAGQDLRRTKRQDHGLEKALDNELIALSPAPALERGEPVRAHAAGPQRQPHRRHDARPRGDQALRRRGLPDGTIDVTLDRLGRPVVRRVPAARHHAAARGRRQRLRRQGPLRRPDRRPPRPRGDVRRRGADHRRQRDRLRRHRPARSSSAAASASGSACATPARPRSSRASATTAAST